MGFEEVKKKYIELRKKHSLPEFNEVEEHFNITSLDSENLTLKSIIKQIKSTIEERAKFFESIIQPDTDITTMHEVEFLNNNDREESIRILRELMKSYRKADLIIFDYEEEEAINYIKETTNKVIELKPRIKKIINKLIRAWDEDLLISSTEDKYFG